MQFIETKDPKSRKEITKKLNECPRVLLTSRIFEEKDLFSIFIAPNNEVIEKGACERIPINHSKINHHRVAIGNLPKKPKYLPIVPRKGNKDKSPCEVVCIDCGLYLEKCPGCPSTKHYDIKK